MDILFSLLILINDKIIVFDSLAIYLIPNNLQLPINLFPFPKSIVLVAYQLPFQSTLQLIFILALLLLTQAFWFIR